MGLEYGFDRGMGCKLERLPVPEKLLHLEIETCQGKKWYFWAIQILSQNQHIRDTRDCL